MSDHTTNDQPGYDGGCHLCSKPAYALAALSEVYHRPPQPGDGPVPLCPQHLQAMEQARIPGEEEYPTSDDELRQQVNELSTRLEDLERRFDALQEVVDRLEGK